MRKRVFEPVGVGVALGALIAALLGQRHNAVRLIFALILLAPFTLGAPEALRRAAGRLTSRSEVDFNIATAIPVTVLFGHFVLPYFAPLLVQNLGQIQRFFPVYDFTVDEIRDWLDAAVMLTLARCACVYFSSKGDRLSFFLTELLSGGAILTAMLLSLNTPDAAKYCMYASVIPVVASFFVFPRRSRDSDEKTPPLRRAFQWLRDVPIALLRLLLFPLLAAAGTWLCGLVPASASIPPFFPEGLSLPVLIGFALCELPRSPFRRDGEGFPGWTALAALIVALAAAGYSLFAAPTTHAVVDVPLYQKLVAAKAELMVLLAMAAGLILYAKPNVRSILTIALLLLGAFSPIASPILAGALNHSTLLWGALAALAAALLSALLYIPEAQRQLRLARIRKTRRAASR